MIIVCQRFDKREGELFKKISEILDALRSLCYFLAH